MSNDLPHDPFILVSYINTLLRDRYDSLDELCQALDIDRNYLVKRMRKVGMEYNSLLNKFW